MKPTNEYKNQAIQNIPMWKSVIRQRSMTHWCCHHKSNTSEWEFSSKSWSV